MQEVNIQPIGNRVLVKRLKAQTSKGGIILPDSAQEKPKQAEVVAIGAGKINDEGDLVRPSVKVGDTVIFSSYAGAKVKHSDESAEYLIMSEDEILAVVRE